MRSKFSKSVRPRCQMRELKENHCQCCSAEHNGEIHLVFDDEGQRLNIASLLVENLTSHSFDENEADNIKIEYWEETFD